MLHLNRGNYLFQSALVILSLRLTSGKPNKLFYKNIYCYVKYHIRLWYFEYLMHTLVTEVCSQTVVYQGYSRQNHFWLFVSDYYLGTVNKVQRLLENGKQWNQPWDPTWWCILVFLPESWIFWFCEEYPLIIAMLQLLAHLEQDF